MTSKQKERIRKLASFLAGPVARAEKRTRRKKLVMRSWSSWNNSKDALSHTDDPEKVGVTKNLCGTAACALGWATAVFPRLLGLLHGEVVLKETGQGSFGETAEISARVFGMTAIQAHKAFLTGMRRRPKEAAKVLRRIAREG